MDGEKKVTYLPLFLNLTDQACLVVGGGKVALRKVEQLLQSDARVTIVAPEIDQNLQEKINPERCVWEQRPYQSPEASKYRLVIATTDDAATNKQIYQDCQAHGILVNVVDQPQLCTVIFPSTVRRGIMTMAISSGGNAPFLTKALRIELENFIDDIELLDKPQILLKFRDFVKSQTDDFEIKRKLYQCLLSCDKDLLSQWSEDDPPYDLWMNWLREAK